MTTITTTRTRPIFFALLVGIVAIAFLFSGCSDGATTPSTDRQQTAQTERMVAEAQRQVGMPAITNFTERKFAKMITELRDTEVATFTYIVDMNGVRHFLTESIGYGIPYSVQFTNPARPLWETGYQSIAGVTVGQPEPNGLFMPTSSSATWVLAVTPEGGISPMYVESEILVSTFRLDD